MVFPLRALLYRNSTPVVTLLLIVVNLFCFLFEIAQPDYLQHRFIAQYALVPDRLHLSALLTSMFLHGGWLHLIGNMWFLWIFGSHVEDELGSIKYLGFYLLSGISAALVQLVMNLGSPVPTIGASGAIAGVMGAFLLLFPKARILTLCFILIFITTFEIPAVFMLLYWFLLQLVSGLTSVGYSSDAQSVAWFAHVGGFLAGMGLLRLFGTSSPARRRLSY